MSKLVSFILKMMVKGGKKVALDLDEKTKHPREEQEKLLMSLLKASENCEIGEKFGFSSIKDVDEFRRRVPFTDYDFYSEYVNRMTLGEENILTSRKTVHFNVTSGTLGVPKLIPVTEEHVQIFSKFNAKYLNYIVGKELGTDWTNGWGLSLAEGTYKLLPTGVSVGCASSLHAARMSQAMPFNKKSDTAAMLYTSPKEARQPEIPGTYSRYLHALFALKQKNITYGNVTFSSYLLEIMRFIENNWETLCDDIEQGDLTTPVNVPDEVRESVKKKLTPDPERARELREIFKKGFDSPCVPLIWPELKFFICVGAAGFQMYTDKLKSRYFGEGIRILYMGLSASECMISVPVKLDSDESVFVPDATFFEFLPVENGETDVSGGTRLLHELEQGKQYELVITNVSGLFRYRMKDVIEVTGFCNATPLMRFVNRSGYAINMYAEKTSNTALQHTAEDACRKLGLDMYDYVVCPYVNDEGGRYVWMYELNSRPADLDLTQLRDITEKLLIKNNPVYGEVTEDGSCRPLEVRILQPQTFLLYRDIMIMKGRSAAQLKPVHVTASPFQEKFFLGLEDK